MTHFSPPKLLAVRLAAFAFALLIAVSALAQIQSGNIYGKVQASDGSAIPGVTVTLTGLGAPQTAVTDAEGNFRFLNLSPGTYAVKAELANFGSATRQGITVNIGRNADVTMTLNASKSESITVTAEAPLLDVRKTGTGAQVTKVELEKVPTARDPWVILQQTPGVLMDRNNVGGNESGQQSVYVSKGTTGVSATWNVDGVNITDFAATGSSPSYFDFDAFEEMQITTGGSDPRIQTPGAQLNMVTKRGTNEFKGSARYFKTDNAWQADPRIPGEATAYLKRVNEINSIEDYGAEIGGPIVRDKLWFWGAYGQQDIDILSASIVAGARFQDKTQLKNENLKLNAQLLPSNSLTAVDQFGAKVKLGRNVSTIRLPETAWNQDNYYGGDTGSLTNPTLWKIEDTQIIGSNLYLTGLYSKVQGGFQLIADNGKGCKTLACGADALPAYRDIAGDGAWHNTYLSVVGDRPQTQYRLDGSGFFNTGSINHELKFGFGYRKATVSSQTIWPGSQFTYNYGPGVGDGNDTGYVSLMRLPPLTYSAKSNDAYVGDTMMFGNLTVEAGLRYDQQKGSNAAGTGVANPIVPDILPAVSFPAVEGLKWTNVSPRLGFTYALGESRRTLLRAAYNRYVDQLSATTVSATSPGASSYIYYYFNDLNGDNQAQRNEIDFNYGVFFHRGPFDPENPASLQQFTRWNNVKAPTTDEFIVGAEHELLSDFSIGANVTYRKLDNFIWTVGEHHQGQGDYYSPSDYELQAPITATLPNGQSATFQYYALKDGIAPPVYNVIINRPDYNQTYKGLELTAVKRMSNRWMLRGNFTLQDWTQHVGPGAISDPTLLRDPGSSSRPGSGLSACPNCDGGQVIYRSTGSGSKGNVYINSKWAYSLTGVYQVPVIETSIGFNLNGRQGYPLPYVYAQKVPGEGTKYLLATDVDAFRGPNVTELDLRIAKDFRLSKVGLTLSIDGFNMLNSNTILQRDVTQINDYGASDHVAEVLSPRVFRVGARLTF